MAAVHSRRTATKKVKAPPAPEPAAAPPAPATSEREKALALWEKAQPHLDKQRNEEEAALRAAEAKVREDEGWAAGELAMLRRRTVSAYEDVELGNGDTIRIRTGLTEPEFDTLVDLDAAEYWIRKTAVAETRILTPRGARADRRDRPGEDRLRDRQPPDHGDLAPGEPGLVPLPGRHQRIPQGHPARPGDGAEARQRGKISRGPGSVSGTANSSGRSA